MRQAGVVGQVTQVGLVVAARSTVMRVDLGLDARDVAVEGVGVVAVPLSTSVPVLSVDGRVGAAAAVVVGTVVTM